MGDFGFSRPLGLGECFYWQMERVSRICFLAYAEVEGQVEAGALAQGLEALQQAHPLLRARIELRDEMPYFVEGAPAPETVWVEGARGAHWEGELERPFDEAVGPLFRCHWGREDGRLWIGLTLHHAIADGRSGTRLLVELLRFLGLGEQPRARALPEALEAHYRPERFGAADLPAHLNAVIADAKRRAEGVTLERPLAGFAQSLRAQRQLRYRPMRLDEEATRRLTARCREQGATVHGLLGAAYLRAAHQAFHEAGEPVVMSLNSPVDLRGRAGAEPALVMGNAAVNSYLRVDGTEDLWDLARRVGADIREQVEVGNAQALYHLVFLKSPPHPSVEAAREMAQRILQRPWTSMLTNIGAQPPVELGRLALRGMGFMVTPLANQMFALGVCSLEGLRVDALYDAGHVPVERAEGVLDAMWGMVGST